MDDGLRTRLWNCVSEHYLGILRMQYPYSLGIEPFSAEKEEVVKNLYHNFLHRPIDIISEDFVVEYNNIRNFFFNATWDEVYDFIEFVVRSIPDDKKKMTLTKSCNRVLQEEMSYYRIVGDLVTPMTSDEEMKAIETAMGCPAEPVRDLMSKALKALSDRKEPNYPSSIKDSVAAVESLCKIIAGDGSKTLVDSLKGVQAKVGLHPALTKSLENLYGYRNVKPGVAHGGTQTAAEGFDEAFFYLVSCSAWVNFLSAKADKAGIRIDN